MMTGEQLDRAIQDRANVQKSDRRGVLLNTLAATFTAVAAPFAVKWLGIDPLIVATAAAAVVFFAASGAASCAANAENARQCKENYMAERQKLAPSPAP